jgi:tRNA (guanine-N7-)-methyltransferase
MPPIAPPDLSPWFRPLEDLDGPVSWSQFFGNDQPVEIDVGSGRGMFLVNSAERNPGINYLGIEVDFREARRAAKRLKRRQLPNARILGGDVRSAFSNYVPPASVSAVHVYFPDPWWKKKHRRRRVFTDEFVNLAAIVLRPGGLLHSWTDVEDYFEVISALMNHHVEFKALAPPAEQQPADDMDYQTSFERRSRKSGFPIHRGLWQRKDRVPNRAP